MKRPSKQVEETPIMPKGETEFEEKRIQCDFQAVFSQISQVGWKAFRDPYEYAYRAGFIAGKSKRELGSPKLPTFIQIL